jgi:hypothetical protein
VRVTLQINLPPYPKEDKKKFIPSYPPIRVRVTLKINLPPYPKEDKKKFYAELPPLSEWG